MQDSTLVVVHRVHAKTRHGHVLAAKVIVGHVLSRTLVARLDLCIDDTLRAESCMRFRVGHKCWKGEKVKGGDGLAMKCGAIQVN